MTPENKPGPAQWDAWQATGVGYKVVAADIAKWAAGKDRGTVTPTPAFFGLDHDSSVYSHARRFLVGQGVLNTHDRRYQVN